MTDSATQRDATVTARSRIGNSWRDASPTVEIVDPFRGTVVGTMPVNNERDCHDALEAAVNASHVMAAMPGFERAALLRRIAHEVEERAAAIGRVMSRETGKALGDCVTEVARSADTLRLCAEEAVRIEGSHVPLDASAIGTGRIAMTLRFPVGVVAAITPFNGPVNLAAHKLGPALAAGNSIVLKPSPKAPLCFHLFIEAAVAAGVPDGAIGALYGDDVGPRLVSDPRVDMVSFTGSIPVGKAIRAACGMKPVALELGGVGPTFVHRDADVAMAAKACARNAMLLAGQSCISVQNVYVHHDIQQSFAELVEREIRAIRVGDPLADGIEVGTVIDKAAARRIVAMVDAAAKAGARIVTGGVAHGAQVEPTLLTRVTADMAVVADEVFGPTMTLQAYTDPAPMFEAISRSAYGLQAGVFTNDLALALAAFRGLRTGGVILNATSRWRADQMPYGGVKDSGMGREGPRYAIRDMTEERLLVLG